MSDCCFLKSFPGGGSGFYDDKIGISGSFAEEIAKDRVSTILSKGQDNLLLQRPPVSRVSSSQEALSELASDPALRGKIVPSGGPPDGGRRDLGGNPGNQGSEIPASGKKDGHLRRTSSSSEADVSETKFIDMLKSNAKKPAPQEPQGAAGASDSTDGAQGGRSGKKKGKKVRPLDSAFLGFKVTSNRIMMGEIQRIDD